MEIRVTADGRSLSAFDARDPLFQNRLVRLDGARPFELGQRAFRQIGGKVDPRQREPAPGAARRERYRLLCQLAGPSQITFGLERVVGGTLQVGGVGLPQGSPLV